ncbi:MAG: hypothetical protein MR224_05495 [Dorea sp.]|nr:hypothetical protein [Dorea sp.]MDY2812975.1 hypothetical protein [Dorea sp.]
MSEREKQILETFGKVIPGMTEEEKNTLVVYGQGIAEGKRLARKEMEERAELEGKKVV